MGEAGWWGNAVARVAVRDRTHAHPLHYNLKAGDIFERDSDSVPEWVRAEIHADLYVGLLFSNTTIVCRAYV